MRLRDKVAIVTGGSSGIGRAICQRFADEGALVAIGDIDIEGGQETLRLIQENRGIATYIRADVSVESDIEAMVEATLRAFGRVDILVNDAAAFVFGKIEDVTQDDWHRVLSVNLVGPANAVKHVVPHMKAAGGGSIVNIASVSSFIAQPGVRALQLVEGRAAAAHAGALRWTLRRTTSASTASARARSGRRHPSGTAPSWAPPRRTSTGRQPRAAT